MARGKGDRNVSDRVLKMIVSVFNESPNATVKEIHRKVETQLGGKGPSVTYIGMQVRKLKSLELEKPWSVGSCKKWNIPHEIIPALIIEQEHSLNIEDMTQVLIGKQIKDFDDRAHKDKEKVYEHIRKVSILTIRRALWFARLYSIVSSMVKNQYPDDTLRQEQVLSEVSQLYTLADQFSEIQGLEFPDTSQLDKILLIDRDISEEALKDMMIVSTVLGSMDEKGKSKYLKQEGKKK
jgi:hypothetical protein